MRWDFYTVMSVSSGVVLMVAGLAGPVVGSARERTNLFIAGVISLAYGVWAASQKSGVFFFSITPAILAVFILFRAAQRLSVAATRTVRPATPTIPTPAANPERGPTTKYVRRSATSSSLQDAYHQPMRGAVAGNSMAYCPQFVLLQAHPDTLQYESAPLRLGWSLDSAVVSLDDGETLRTSWQCSARLKVAVGKDLRPAQITPGVSWVTVFDGSGLVGVTKSRIVGLVVKGQSLVGDLHWNRDASVAMWSFPLERCISIEQSQSRYGTDVVLVADSPAGRLTLTRFSPVSTDPTKTEVIAGERVARFLDATRIRLQSPPSTT
jgi:hypothetical protein